MCRTVDSLPADDDAVIGAVNLCVPCPESLVKSRRNKLGKDTLELGATEERDVTPVWKIVEQRR